MMNEIVNENGQFVEPVTPAYRSTLAAGEPTVHAWAAHAEIGWVPTTSLVPYRIVESEYELYDRLAFLLPGFIVSIGLAFGLMSERTGMWYLLGALLLALLAMEGFFVWRFLDLRGKKEKRWAQMMEEVKPVKVYTSFETARSNHNE